MKRAVKHAKSRPVVFTIGHSTRTLEQFLTLLKAHRVKWLIDIRTLPRSRHNPQYNRDVLPRSLQGAGIGYVHMPALGGLRHAAKNSVNTGWRNSSFRGFADYMQSPEFESGLEELVELAEDTQVALMCAEAVPWRCHRSLIADALLIRQIPTEHIMSAASRHLHILTPFAKVHDGRIIYPGSADPKE